MKLIQSVKEWAEEINWRAPLSGRFWLLAPRRTWRWFRKSWMQSGRVTALLVLMALLWVRFEETPLLQQLSWFTFDSYQRIKPRVICGTPEAQAAEQSPVRLVLDKATRWTETAMSWVGVEVEHEGKSGCLPRLVTIVDIDEKSLARVGQFPWSRTRLADLTSRLAQMGAAVVTYDIFFTEPDRTSVSELLDVLPGLDEDLRARLANVPSNDYIFADAIARSGNTVLGMSARPSNVVEGETFISKAPVSFLSTGGTDDTPQKYLVSHQGQSVLQPIPILRDVAQGLGVATFSPEVDGVVRRVPMIVKYDDAVYPSLTTETLRLAFARAMNSPRLPMFIDLKRGVPPLEGIKGLKFRLRIPQGVRDFVIPTDEKGNMWPYFSPQDHGKYVSASDVLEGTVDPLRIQGRMVLIGTSATGLLDVRTTPLNSFLPGVEVHANILENILQNTQLKRPINAPTVEILGTAVGGLLMILFTPFFGARLTGIIFVLVAGSMAVGSWYQFDQNLTLYDPVFPILTSFLMFAFLTFASYSQEEAKRKEIRGAFGQYLSPDLVKQVSKDPSRLQLGGEMRHMTMMFCDVRGFTSISELFDAEGLTSLINRLLTPMTDVILNNRGTIDKYMGDCIMAFWNAPLKDPDQERHACLSALAMIEAVKQVNVEVGAELRAEGREPVPLKVGLGINSGEVCVGNMGSEQRFDYSVLGDSVNLASRLEGQSKTYGVLTVVGESTYPKVTDFALIELDLIMVKGKTAAVRIYGLIGDPKLAETPEFKAFAEEHAAMLAAYRAQDWDGCLARIEACKQMARDAGWEMIDPTAAYGLFEERIAEFKANPPPADWDGVFVATSK